MDLAELIIKLRTGHYQRSPRGWSRDRWATVRGGGLIESCWQGRGGKRDRWRCAGLAAQPRSAGLAAAGRAVVAGAVGGPGALQQWHGGHLPSDGSQESGQSGAHHQAAAPTVSLGSSGRAGGPTARPGRFPGPGGGPARRGPRPGAGAAGPRCGHRGTGLARRPGAARRSPAAVGVVLIGWTIATALRPVRGRRDADRRPCCDRPSLGWWCPGLTGS
jgi:hypothetical protein